MGMHPSSESFSLDFYRTKEALLSKTLSGRDEIIPCKKKTRSKGEIYSTSGETHSEDGTKATSKSQTARSRL